MKDFKYYILEVAIEKLHYEINYKTIHSFDSCNIKKHYKIMCT